MVPQDSSFVQEILSSLMDEWAEALRALLETKHIYQRVVVDPNRAIGPVVERLRPGHGLDAAAFQDIRLFPGTSKLVEVGHNGERNVMPTLVVKNVKLYCRTCDEREVFANSWCVDAVGEIERAAGAWRFGLPSDRPARGDFQIFVLAYECQRCKGEPEVFVVRRDGWAISLHGRSPMEQVSVAGWVPKKEAHLYRDAIIASHGGKVLAALFYLRTFVEQFARRVTTTSGRVTGEDLMEAYAATLPPQQRDQMPSLRLWYEKISDAVHAAREDPELFEAARASIEQHFEIRRVFKMTEGTPRSA